MTTRIDLGDLTLHRIVELEMPLLPALKMFPDLTPDRLAENRDWLQPAALGPDDIINITVQSYVVRTPHHTILVDACVGNDKERSGFDAWNRRSGSTYMDALAAAGIGVGDIDYVLCTHLHADHVGWNTRLENGRWVPTFPKARYLFAQGEYDHWAAQNEKQPVLPFQDSVLPVMEAGRADLVTDTHAIGDHVRLLPTPGHTSGHVSILVGRGRDDALLTGDAIHSPLQLRYPDLSPFFDADPRLAAETRRTMLERLCDTDTLCCTVHFPQPSGGRITRLGQGFRCDMP